MSPLETRRIHIGAWQTSGMSQAAYCREHGLNTKTFGNWVRKHRAGQVIRTKRAQTAGSEESGADAGTGTFAPHSLRRKERSAVAQVQFSLFEEDWQTDVAAIEAEIEKLPLPAPQKPKRASAGRWAPAVAGSSAAYRTPP